MSRLATKPIKFESSINTELKSDKSSDQHSETGYNNWKRRFGYPEDQGNDCKTGKKK